MTVDEHLISMKEPGGMGVMGIDGLRGNLKYLESDQARADGWNEENRVNLAKAIRLLIADKISELSINETAILFASMLERDERNQA